MIGDGEAGIVTKIRARQPTKIDSILGRGREFFSKESCRLLGPYSG